MQGPLIDYFISEHMDVTADPATEPHNLVLQCTLIHGSLYTRPEGLFKPVRPIKYVRPAVSSSVNQ